MVIDVVELSIGPESDDVRRARRFVAMALADEQSNLVEDAELVAAELVTNAQLHGTAPIRLRLSASNDTVRIEVEDAGHEVPVQLRASADAMTGRGLGLVAALSRSWGVDATSSGKTVWAELSTAGGTSAAPELDIDALLFSWADDSGDPLFTVELGDVPTDLLLDAKAHIDNLVREFTLTASRASEPDAKELPAEYAALIEVVVNSFAKARAQVKRQAVEAAGRGEAWTHLSLELPLSAAEAGERYLAALDRADDYARAARLLTLATPPVHRVFRRWYVQSLVDQLRALAARRPAPAQQSFAQHLAGEYTRIAAVEPVAQRLALLQRVTAELTAATTVDEVATTVVENAVTSLAADAAVVYLLEDGMLRALAAAGSADSNVKAQYQAFPAAADLPGGHVLRTQEPLLIRNIAELTSRWPALEGAYDDERTLLLAPVTVEGNQLGVITLVFKHGEDIDQTAYLRLLGTLGQVTAQALDRAMASAAAARVSRQLAFLAEASEELARTWDYRLLIESLARLVVPQWADWCAIQLLQDDVLVTVGLAHVDPSKVTWARELEDRYPPDMTAETGAANVIRTGVSELYSDVSDEMLEASAIDAEHLQIMREVGFRSAVVVPLLGRSNAIGAITAIAAESGRRYDSSDVAFFEDLARRIALAVETTRLLAQHGVPHP